MTTQTLRRLVFIVCASVTIGIVWFYLATANEHKYVEIKLVCLPLLLVAMGVAAGILAGDPGGHDGGPVDYV